MSADVVPAESLYARMKGLLGRENLGAGEAMLIRPCKGIHTMLMRFSIDAAFLDRKNVVVAVRKNLPPNRMTRLYFKAASVLELPEGTLPATDTGVGDLLEIS